MDKGGIAAVEFLCQDDLLADSQTIQEPANAGNVVVQDFPALGRSFKLVYDPRNIFLLLFFPSFKFEILHNRL